MNKARWPSATVKVDLEEFEKFNRRYDALLEGLKDLASFSNQDEKIRNAAIEVLARLDVA